MIERDRRAGQCGDPGGVHELAGTPGKRTLTSSLTVQRQASSPEPVPSVSAVQDAAARGIATPTSALPHADRIQGSFGSLYDVSSIHAHVGGGAAAACADMGASAFASGSHVVFSGTPELHTAAHEAAHVVQQARGVNVHGGVGAAGDAYERQADAVADRVVAGRSVAELFGPPAWANPAERGAKSAPPTGRNAPVQKEEGRISHQGNVGSGTVTAREDDDDPEQDSNNNYSLEYAGADADKAHWLQFVNISMYAEVPPGRRIYRRGSVATTGGRQKLSSDQVTHWSVDSTSADNPYYEAGGVNERTPKRSTKIFDHPGGKSIESVARELIQTKAPGATRVSCVYGFDTYLLLRRNVVYHVTWGATTHYDPAANSTSSIEYETGHGGEVAGLPENLKVVVLARYPHLAPKPSTPQPLARAGTAGPAAVSKPRGVPVDRSRKGLKKQHRNQRRARQRKHKRNQNKANSDAIV